VVLREEMERRREILGGKPFGEERKWLKRLTNAGFEIMKRERERDDVAPCHVSKDGL
jgi:hypothetical protein